MSRERASRERARSRAHSHTERGERARTLTRGERGAPSLGACACAARMHACMYHRYVQVQVCMQVYTPLCVCGGHSVTHTCMQQCDTHVMYAYTHYTCVNALARMRECTRTHVFATCTHVFMRACTHISLGMHARMCAPMYVCHTYICMYDPTRMCMEGRPARPR